MIFNTVEIVGNLEKDCEISKTWSLTKKVMRNFGRENGNFSWKNVIHKSWSPNFLAVPQTRRQVSAYASYRSNAKTGHSESLYVQLNVCIQEDALYIIILRLLGLKQRSYS